MIPRVSQYPFYYSISSNDMKHSSPWFSDLPFSSFAFDRTHWKFCCLYTSMMHKDDLQKYEMWPGGLWILFPPFLEKNRIKLLKLLFIPHTADALRVLLFFENLLHRWGYNLVLIHHHPMMLEYIIDLFLPCIDWIPAISPRILSLII